MGRNSDANVLVRQNDIQEMLLQGKTTAFIIAYCYKEYGISRKTVEKD